MTRKPKKNLSFLKKYLALTVVLCFLSGIFLSGCSHFSAVKETTPNVNSYLTSLYPASPSPFCEKAEQRIPLIDGYDEESYELSYSEKDFYCLKNWSWEPAENLKIKLDDGYLLVGYIPLGATAAVILPKGKLLLFEKESTGWKKISAVSLYIRFRPDELGNIFSQSVIESSEDRELFLKATEVVKHKIGNWWSSWTKGDKFWKVMIFDDPGHYAIDIDAFQGKRFGWRVTNNKGVKSKNPILSRSSSAPPLRDTKISPIQAKENFELVWSNFDRVYPSFVRKGIDWKAIKERYAPQAEKAATIGEFLNIIQEMLSQLKDSHIWMNTPEGQRDTYEEETFWNYNFSALRKYMESIEQIGRTILLGKTSDNIVYVAFNSWNTSVENDIEEFKKFFPDIMNSRGMIVDVRANYGGNETLAKGIAALFTDEPIVYARSQFRDESLHTDLTEPYDRILKPNEEGIYYSKPVVLLIGQGCASSNESFVSAMNQLPQVTLVGDRTAGSSGNPTFVELNLPVKVSVGIPQWIDLLPDGTPLEEKGIQPDIFVKASKEDFSGDNDPVLEKGLEELRNICNSN